MGQSPKMLSVSLIFTVFYMFLSVSQHNWKKDLVNPFQTGATNPGWDVWPNWCSRLWFGTPSPCSYNDEHSIKIQTFFNLMARSHYSITQKSMNIVSAMQLETSIIKMRIKKSIGKVVTCEKSWVFPSLFSLWPKSRLLIWLAELSRAEWCPSHYQHKSCSDVYTEGSSPLSKGAQPA